MSTSTQRPIFSRVLHIVVYYLVFTLLGLGFLEMAVRIGYPEIEPTGNSHDLEMDAVYGGSSGLRPLTSGLSGGKMFSVDALGFWKYAGQSDSLQKGWLLLGDSVTMGIGVEPDSTFAGRLAVLCRAWHILNPSWIGYSSADYVNVIRGILFEQGKANSAMPTIRRITLFWTLNDIYSDRLVGSVPGQVVRDYSSTIFLWLKQRYRTYPWLKSLLFDRPKAYFQFDAQFYHYGDSCFSSVSRDLATIREMCTKTGTQLHVVLLPYEYQLRQADSAVYRPQVLLSRELDSLQIPWYDFASIFRGVPGNHKNLYLFGDGIHFSKRGHSEIARYVRDAIGSLPQ